MTTPLVWPRAGTSGQALANCLRNILDKAYGVPAHPQTDLAGYIDWCIESADALGYLANTDDVNRLVRTPAFWAALSMLPDGERDRRFVQAEMAARRTDLQRAVDSLEHFLRRFEGVPEAAMILVPDTNVLIAHAHQAAGTDWHAMLQQYEPRPDDTVRLVIPLVGCASLMWPHLRAQ